MGIISSENTNDVIQELKKFAQHWNYLYKTEQFEEMKLLATEDVGIANAQDSNYPSGLIYGRDAYYKGIYDTYHGSDGTEKNILVMQYEDWEYIPLGDNNTFYTIGKYIIYSSSSVASSPNIVGVNCWLLHRHCPDEWQIFRVINN